MRQQSLMKYLVAMGIAICTLSGVSHAQEVTLKLHQFLPPPARIPAEILKPWAANVEKASEGRIKIEHYDAMALGGKPPELMDQARDGVVDIVMTLGGYTPGRFPKTEVFELPFIMKDSVATSLAYWEMVDTTLQNEEFKDVQILSAWVHGPGVIHSKDPIKSLADLKGKKIRGPTRVINDMLKELGATPVGMPVPAIPEALSKGVIDGTVIPWEITTALKIAELVPNHTEFAGDTAFYTAAFVVAMNKAKYDSLPDDLKAILDEQSGPVLSTLAATVMAGGDAPARAIAAERGNNIITLGPDDVGFWQAAAMPVRARWIEQMKGRDIDGAAVIAEAEALIEKHAQ